MSLFPAYTDTSVQKGESTSVNEEAARPAWLNIESFPVNLQDIPLPEEPQNKPEESRSSSPEIIVEVHKKDVTKERKSKKGGKEVKRAKKKVKHRHHKLLEEISVDNVAENEFFEDRHGVKGYLSVKTLTRPLVPQYYTKYRILGKCFYWLDERKKMKKSRYFLQMLDISEGSSTGKSKSTELGDGYTFHLEEELSQRTSDYNKMLTEDPSNVELWLEYVGFQDTIHQFEHSYRKGDSAKSLRVTMERKISILDKALSENPQDERLLQERFSVAERLYPADSLSQQLAQMVDKSPKSIVLWRSFIRITQGSLSLCNTTAVLKLYEKGMKKIHQFRRGAAAKTIVPIESNILDLLLECGLFLRQAGLWEQLWTLLRIYLELNLAHPESNLFKDFASVPEDIITGLEETVLNSQLPLPELWFRIEKLREAAHWLPWTSGGECEDPQRLVFVDDVSDMLHPITSSCLSFRLALIAVSLLKVPFLPSRHTTMQMVGLDQIPSSVDHVEALLAMYYPQNIIVLNDKSFLQGALNLVYGPQYLTSSWPGQENYLEFVIKVFHSCAQCLKEPAKTAMFIWWLRFERFLVILSNNEHCKLPASKSKKTKSLIKDFLKCEENRNNGLYYVEYALFELALGQADSACKVLTTAIAAQKVASVISVASDEKKGELCRMYRTLCEMFVCSNLHTGGLELKDEEKLLGLLKGLVTSTPVVNWQNSEETISTEEIYMVTDKFRHISTELLRSISSEEADGTEHLLPDFIVDWVACYGWWLLFTQNVWEAGTIFEEALYKIPAAKSPDSTPLLRSTCQREGIFEGYIGLLYYHCKNNTGVYAVLQDALHRGLQEFPNNLHMLSVIANVESTLSCITGSRWKLTKYIQDSNYSLAQIFQIFYLRYQSGMLQIATQQTYDFLKAGGPVIPDPSVNNRLSAMYGRLLSNSASKRCPMLWRLYLRFLAELGQESSYHSTFYRAVEECPWVKVLYTEAVKLLPAELPQLQDLLIEKELRIHVTPDELDILRQDPLEVVQMTEK